LARFSAQSGLHHAGLGRFGLDEKAVLLPEVLHQRPELLGNLVLHHQPALGAGALDVILSTCGSTAVLAGARLLLALGLEPESVAEDLRFRAPRSGYRAPAR